MTVYDAQPELQPASYRRLRCRHQEKKDTSILNIGHIEYGAETQRQCGVLRAHAVIVIHCMCERRWLLVMAIDALGPIIP